MQKLCWLWVLLCLIQGASAQTKPLKRIQKNKLFDSLEAVKTGEDMVYDLPVLALTDMEKGDGDAGFLPSLLYANRDVLQTMAAFHFNPMRFRLRGYDASCSETKINGISMNNPDDGVTQWNMWSGLNDVTRNTQNWLGLRNSELSFGNIGTNTAIDMRASKQRVQDQFSYAFSNRSFTHRWMYTRSKGFNHKGWAYTVSASWRSALEGYVPGTSHSGAGYFIGIDKRVGQDRLLSLVFFGSATVNARQGAILEESVALAGSNFYNPYWGYQSGKKRNANVSSAHQPVVILTHDLRFNNHTTWVSAISFTEGSKSTTALDWYNAPDPRPDYYRYLPGYQKDSLMRIQLTEAMSNNEQLRQINWDHLYDVNRNSRETIADVDGVAGNTVSGLRSHYILEERVTEIKRFDINSVFNTIINPAISFSSGISFQLQHSRYFERVNDLLGGDYFADLNQFAERDFLNNEKLIQNDLNHPNRVLHAGDVYGYDYAVLTRKANGWLQINGVQRKVDYFTALLLGYTAYLRDGHMQNGLFPENSFGRSRLNEFTHYAFKAGITYKINGRKYLYLHGAAITKAPLFDDVFISPRTRDTEQDHIDNEKIQTLELGYVRNTPRLKCRLSSYLTRFSHGMNVTTFYHDGYGGFVNYALSGIQKVHIGAELGIEWKLSAHYSVNIAASVGRYYENSRQQVTATMDNDASVLERTLVYSKNFRVAGTPQEAYGFGLHYQSSGAFYLDVSGSYFTQQWLSYNPLRRTYAAIENIVPGTDQWKRMIEQISLPVQYTIDLSAGSSVRTKLFGSKTKRTILFHLSINNLLDNRHLISGGYEQLRFDANEKDPDKFPPKLFYAMGLNFSANITLRLL